MVEFKIHVHWKQKELSFPAKLLQLGYLYKIEALVEGTTVLFDRDEDLEWRAITYQEKELPDVGLIQVIIEELKSI
jgi:hypothetical protein